MTTAKRRAEEGEGRSRRVRRGARWVGLGLAALVGIFALATLARQDRRFEAKAPEVHASVDPTVIARGREIVQGPAHCADCHGEDLSGGRAFRLPVGTFHVPNITSDAQAGIGKLGDEDVARILRHGVRPDGTAVLPFMPFADLSDEDLGAVVSYLRTVPPVSHAVPPHEVSLAGRVVKAWVLAPRGPSVPPRASVPRGPTPEYGEYLARSVANCVGCHTRIDLRTGAFAGPVFGGGGTHASVDDPARSFVAPNLTPDARWGWISGWSEEAFVARFRAGRTQAGSPMPWPSFQRMGDDDLRALYRYLQTVPAAAGGPDPRDRSTVTLAASR